MGASPCEDECGTDEDCPAGVLCCIGGCLKPGTIGENDDDFYKICLYPGRTVIQFIFNQVFRRKGLANWNIRLFVCSYFLSVTVNGKGTLSTPLTVKFETRVPFMKDSRSDFLTQM